MKKIILKLAIIAHSGAERSHDLRIVVSEVLILKDEPERNMNRP